MLGANIFPPMIGSHRQEEGSTRSDALFIVIAISYAQQLLSLICLKLQGLLNMPGCHLPVLNRGEGRRPGHCTTPIIQGYCKSACFPACFSAANFQAQPSPSFSAKGFFLCTANHSLPSVLKALQGRNLLFFFCKSALNTPTATQKNV